QSAEAQNDAVQQSPRREIVFVDTAISGYQQLLADLHDDPGAAVETIFLDPRGSGIEQISDVLSQRQDIDAIHIVSHGVDGAIALGAGTLSAANLSDHAAAIREW